MARGNLIGVLQASHASWTVGVWVGVECGVVVVGTIVHVHGDTTETTTEEEGHTVVLAALATTEVHYGLREYATDGPETIEAPRVFSATVQGEYTIDCDALGWGRVSIRPIGTLRVMLPNEEVSVIDVSSCMHVVSEIQSLSLSY